MCTKSNGIVERHSQPDSSESRDIDDSEKMDYFKLQKCSYMKRTGDEPIRNAEKQVN